MLNTSNLPYYLLFTVTQTFTIISCADIITKGNPNQRDIYYLHLISFGEIFIVEYTSR